jgi:hypothetical protein
MLGKKGNKSGNMDRSMEFLAESLGGNSSVKKNAPICAGRYNESKAMEVSSKFVHISIKINQQIPRD